MKCNKESPILIESAYLIDIADDQPQNFSFS